MTNLILFAVYTGLRLGCRNETIPAPMVFLRKQSVLGRNAVVEGKSVEEEEQDKSNI